MLSMGKCPYPDIFENNVWPLLKLFWIISAKPHKSFLKIALKMHLVQMAVDFWLLQLDDAKVSILDFWGSHLSTSGHCVVLFSRLANKVKVFFKHVLSTPKTLRTDCESSSEVLFFFPLSLHFL